MHRPLEAAEHRCPLKARLGVCQDKDGEKELGIGPVIIVTITGSSAAVIVIEKDGGHSLPFLFASAKYDNCFFRDFLGKLSIDHLHILIYLQAFIEDKALVSATSASVTTVMTNHPGYSFP